MRNSIIPVQKPNSNYDIQSVDSCLGSAVFTHSKVALWQATIVENALKRLAALNKPFKYVGKYYSVHRAQVVPVDLNLSENPTFFPLGAVTCMISQNTGGATHTAHTCFWDAETDGK